MVHSLSTVRCVLCTFHTQTRFYSVGYGVGMEYTAGECRTQHCSFGRHIFSPESRNLCSVFFSSLCFFFTQNCRGMSEKNSRPPQLCLSQGQSGRKFLEEKRAKKVGCCLVCRGEGRQRPGVVLSTRCAFYFIADGDGHDWSL